jgi:hypothetical protein
MDLQTRRSTKVAFAKLRSPGHTSGSLQSWVFFSLDPASPVSPKALWPLWRTCDSVPNICSLTLARARAD